MFITAVISFKNKIIPCHKCEGFKKVKIYLKSTVSSWADRTFRALQRNRCNSKCIVIIFYGNHKQEASLKRVVLPTLIITEWMTKMKIIFKVTTRNFLSIVSWVLTYKFPLTASETPSKKDCCFYVATISPSPCKLRTIYCRPTAVFQVCIKFIRRDSELYFTCPFCYWATSCS